jgi:hypothetical protein
MPTNPATKYAARPVPVRRLGTALARPGHSVCWGVGAATSTRAVPFVRVWHTQPPLFRAPFEGASGVGPRMVHHHFMTATTKKEDDADVKMVDTTRAGFLRSIQSVERMTLLVQTDRTTKQQAEIWLQIVGWIGTDNVLC